MFIFDSDEYKERIPKFKTTSEEGVIPRGQRADMKLFDESSGYKTNKSLKSMLSKITEYELKERERQSKMDKLEELCKPISDYLRDNYCPHDSIVITDDKIRLVRDEIGIPVDRDCKKEAEEFCLYDKWLLRK